MRFFFYGTLMDADVRRLVIRRRPESYSVEPAVLPGYRRVVMRGRTYPVVVVHPPGRVDGILVRGLDRGDAARLAAFEGEEYDAVPCAVRTAAGVTVTGWVFAAGALARPSALPWDPALWRRRHKRDVQRRLRAGAGG